MQSGGSRAGERGPYLLVGHSLGGLFVRRYAKAYPGEVAGLLLLDSSHEDARRYAVPEILEIQARALAARAAQLKAWHASGQFEEMTFHDRLPKRLAEVLKPRSAAASWWDARFAENALPDVDDAATPEQRRLTVPIVVISATKWPTPRRFPAAAWKKQMETRMRLQEELASRSADSKQVFASTEHHIQFDDPDLVIKTVLELARRLR